MSVYKRGKTYVMDFVIDGVRTVKSCKTTSKREAKHQEGIERQKVLSESKLSPIQKVSRLRLQDAIQQVYDVRWKLTKDHNGTLNRATRLSVLLDNPPIGSIDETAVQGLLRSLEKTDSENATINRYLTCLKTILNHFRLDNHFINLRKERNGRIRTITKCEELELLALLRCKDFGSKQSHYPDCADLFECLLETGCRLSELLDLAYNDVDFEADHIRIWINKGDRPRSVPMTTKVRSILDARLKINSVKPFSINKFQAERAWSYARRHMGLDADNEFCIHCLRHSAASRLINAGVDLYIVKEILGHSSIKVTERYAHLDPSKLADAVRLLN